jgi:hypothetical protein
MGWYVAPACKAALAEANRLWPQRNRASDGTIGDPAHSTRTSDHNPDADGAVLAFDLTHDPAAGCDAHHLVRHAVERRDPRIKYAISNRRIWSAVRADEGWRPYTGSNPHTTHAHVSVRKEYENDTRPWWRPPEPTPDPDPAPLLEEDDVARLIKAPDKGATFGTDGTQRWHVPSPPVLKELVAIGLYGDGRTHVVSQETIDALPLVERAK